MEKYKKAKRFSSKFRRVLVYSAFLFFLPPKFLCDSFCFILTEFFFKDQIQFRTFVKQSYVISKTSLFFILIIRIISITHGQFIIGDDPKFRSDFIDEITIMRDKENSSFVVLQRLFQCFACFVIQVIRWFIEY